MAYVTLSPLGDSQFADIGESSPNGFGVTIYYQTDLLGGSIPANIPNPPLVFEWPEDWGGSTPVMPYVPMPEIPRLPTMPVCHKGCAVDVPTPLEPVPEPWYGALILVAVLVGIACRKTRSIL